MRLLFAALALILLGILADSSHPKARPEYPGGGPPPTCPFTNCPPIHQGHT